MLVVGPQGPHNIYLSQRTALGTLEETADMTPVLYPSWPEHMQHDSALTFSAQLSTSISSGRQLGDDN